MTWKTKSSVAARVALIILVGVISAHSYSSVDHRGSCYGKPNKEGVTALVDNGRGFDLTGYGTEYGFHCKEDQGRFVFRAIKGDFDISAQVTALRNDKGSACKAAILARASATAVGAKYAGIVAMSDVPHTSHKKGGYPDSYTFDARTRDGGTMKGGFDYHPLSGSIKRNFPDVWIRLKRSGSKFQAFRSTDGKNWIELPSLGRLSNYKPFGLSLPETAYVGFAVSSDPEGNPNLRSMASFRNIQGFFPGGPTSLARQAPVDHRDAGSVSRVLGGEGLSIGFATPNGQSGTLLWHDVRGVRSRSLMIHPPHEVAP